jgi:hypothetical protein
LSTHRIYLVLPAVVPFAIDAALTLIRQPADYWQGNFWLANESAVVGLYLLQWHPLAFAAASLVYATGFAAAIRYLPEPIARWLSFGFLIAHSSGINSWLQYHYILEPIHNCLAALFAAWCYSAYFRRIGRAEHSASKLAG